MSLGKSGHGGDDDDDDHDTTPPPKKHKVAGEDEEDNASAPKQLARSPTLHYSPIEGKVKGEEIEMSSEAEETEKPPPPPPKKKSENKVAQPPEEKKTEKKTACKRRASKPEDQEEKKDMPKKKKNTETQPDEQVPKQVSKPPKSAKDPAASLPSPKQEPPSTDVAIAVNSSLARAATVDLQSVATSEITLGNDEPDSAAAGGSPGDPGDDPEGVTAQEVRRRKEIHARYMRFSRSLKSILANLSALFPILLFCVHVQYKR